MRCCFSLSGLLRHRILCHIALALVVLLGAGMATAADSVAVVLSERGGVYAEFFDALNANLAQTPGRKAVKLAGVVGDKLDGVDLAGASLVIAVGANASRTLAHMDNIGPVLSVLIPRLSFEHIAAESGRLRQRNAFSAIFLDQPLGRQLGLLRYALPGRKRLAVLLGPESATQLPRLRSAVARIGLELQTEQVAAETDIIPALNRLLPANDVLLALPDGVVYNRDTARPILLTTYRHQRPLLGFSQAYVAAGALAAVYSTPTQLAWQTAEFLRTLPPGRVTLGPPQYPRYFGVAVNRNVARSLGLDIPDEASLRDAVERGGDEE